MMRLRRREKQLGSDYMGKRWPPLLVSTPKKTGTEEKVESSLLAKMLLQALTTPRVQGALAGPTAAINAGKEKNRALQAG